MNISPLNSFFENRTQRHLTLPKPESVIYREMLTSLPNIDQMSQQITVNALQSLESLPEKIQKLEKCMTSTNYSRAYQIQNYRAEDGLGEIVSILNEISAKWQPYSRVDEFCRSFIEQFGPHLQNFFQSIIDQRTNEFQERPPSESEQLEWDMLLEDPISGALESLKSSLNTYNIPSTNEYPTRQPERKDFAAIAFLEDVLLKLSPSNR